MGATFNTGISRSLPVTFGEVAFQTPKTFYLIPTYGQRERDILKEQLKLVGVQALATYILTKDGDRVPIIKVEKTKVSCIGSKVFSNRKNKPLLIGLTAKFTIKDKYDA